MRNLVIRTANARWLIPILAVGIGWSVSRATSPVNAADSGWYQGLSVTLLVIGLLGSTLTIELGDVRAHWKLVLTAVTLGVCAKAFLISVVMLAVLHSPVAIVLGVAVAQIDPLSVAARRNIGLSRRARAILSAWASFDDPVTVLLTVSVSSLVFIHSDLGAGSGSGQPISLHGAAFSLVGSVVLIAAAAGLWRVLKTATPDRGNQIRAAEIVVLIALALIAARFSLFLGIATVGLFFRPLLPALAQRIPAAAFAVAAFLVGLVLGPTPRIGVAVALGVAAFVAHALVSLPLTLKLPTSDRISLALAQQNGITAIVLALVLERQFPGTVAVVAPAVLVIAVLYVVTNTAWNQHVEGKKKPGRRHPIRPLAGTTPKERATI